MGTRLRQLYSDTTDPTIKYLQYILENELGKSDLVSREAEWMVKDTNLSCPCLFHLDLLPLLFQFYRLNSGLEHVTEMLPLLASTVLKAVPVLFL